MTMTMMAFKSRILPLRKSTTILQMSLTITMFIILCSLVNISFGQQDTAMRNYTISELQPCTLSSLELSKLGPNDEIEPCILYDIQPRTTRNNDDNNTLSTSFIVPIVQVTPTNCHNHRDGAVTGVKFINQDNNGYGIRIGFQNEQPSTQTTPVEENVTDAVASEITAQQLQQNNTYIQFHLISVVAGNPSNLSELEYDHRHTQVLSSIITTYNNVPYIIGTCSFASEIEKQIANDYKSIIMAQVGPPGFYQQQSQNSYVFGFHINSDTYPLPNVQSLTFVANEQPNRLSSIPIRVIYRSKSEFFYSTCQSAINNLKQAGFTNIQEYLYDHSDDHDNDRVINEFDKDFLIDIADQACYHSHNQHHGNKYKHNRHYGNNNVNNDQSFHPALFVCTLTEQDILIERWLETGCRPLSVWMAASTWGWASDHPQFVPYFQGGGQWHPAFTYSDRYFDSGSDLLAYNEALFGYAGSYDQLVSYAIPVLYAQHMIASYRVVDNPNPIADFSSPEGRELLRRDMLVLKADTIFGPISFDKNQRNNGRDAAGTQWLPATAQEPVAANPENLQAKEIARIENVTEMSKSILFENLLIAPFLQAEAATLIPAASAIACPAGFFIDDTGRAKEGSILKSGCTACPVDTFLSEASQSFACNPCPLGSTSNGLEGQEVCYAIEDNLLSPGILIFGYVAVAITWTLSLTFMAWILMYRNDPVVKMSQMEFLVLICIGAMISSSTIIALSVQAGTEENTSRASAGCTVAPFLYAIGWALQYSSLSAKTFRLYAIMRNNRHLKRVKVTFRKMLRIVFVVLAIDIAILIAWFIVSPLVYERSEENINIDRNSGVVTIESVGSCVMGNQSISFWAFAGPIICFHFLLLIGTNVLLYNVRDVSDRYQEQKYIGMASMLMFEILIVGIPVLVAVNDSPVATYIVLIGIIALDDIGIICFTFIPKVLFQRAGLEDGVGFGESIMRESHRRASTRELVRRDSRMQAYGPSEMSISTGLVRVEEFNDSIPKECSRSSNKGLITQSIAEENSKDLDLENSKQGDKDLAAAEARLREAEQNVTQRINSCPGSLIAPAGSSIASADIGNVDSINNVANKNVAAVNMVNEQERMMEMTEQLMEQHEQMMKATASMMSEHKRLRQRLMEEDEKQLAADRAAAEATTATTGSPGIENAKPPIPQVIQTASADFGDNHAIESSTCVEGVANDTDHQHSSDTELTDDDASETVGMYKVNETNQN